MSRDPEKRKAQRAAAAKKKGTAYWTAVSKRYRENNRSTVTDKQRASDLKKYGITPEEFDRLYRLQNGVCAVCRQPETSTRLGKLKSLAVDHDHETNKVRGLLCAKHNMGVGMFNDNPVLLRATADYLEKNR